ncbi:MAG TPA: deoxyguanosinetriphosphate triphosphohydrolase [Alphaproteobacteria bacterium]|nr:deoxyguanosinetriphosphate triphosphohydrolase [Alphaproteobacteria bacterium]
MTVPAQPYALAPFATRPDQTRGRLHPETESPTRTPFQRDRDRVVHAAAFRRLKHKTQVFVAHEGDNFRTRLTHSLEVAQIARSISRVLGLNEDLAEALALAHDLGHTPFGHAGEDALNAVMAAHGGFDHNVQTLRILTRLERKYAEFDGLNLTWETLEGVVKHNGPLSGPNIDAVPEPIRDYVAGHDLELDTYPGAEAQVAALADDIAYNNHDIDDGLRAGLFTLDDLRDLPLAGPTIRVVEAAYPGLEQPRLIHETVRRLIDHMVTDLLDETQARLADAAPGSVEEIRELGRPVVAFSQEMISHDKALRSFLGERMYRHHMVQRMTAKAGRVVGDLFEAFVSDPGLLPAEWRARGEGRDEARAARLVADYIAGMTDSFALSEHQRLFDTGTLIPGTITL